MVEAHIDLSALRSNALAARALAPGSAAMAVIKANAYGHGLLPVARALREIVDGFAVARLDEAVLLRRCGIGNRLLVLSSLPTQPQLNQLSAAGIDLVVHETTTATQLIRNPLPKPINVWLKIDSGMHRLGVAPDQVASLYHALRGSGSVGQIVLMSHFASADQPDDPFNEQQLRLVERVTQPLPGAVSMANSAAIMTRRDSHRDWIRPGIMLYGVNPLAGAAPVQLRPVMTLRSQLIATKRIETGHSVGYNRSWISPRDTWIGTVSGGYGDGYPRHARTGTPVLVNGRRVPLVGRVSMDSINVDLGPAPVERAGDPAILWGAGLSVNEIAACAGTIGYELLTRVTRRVRCHYLDA